MEQTDPDMSRFLELLETGGPFEPPTGDFAAFRDRGARLRRKLDLRPDLSVLSDTLVIPTSWGALPAEIFRRTDHRGPSAAIVYLHGGGWTTCSVGTHRPLIRAYAAYSGAAVIGLDYALAPETPFPGAVLQCVAALVWIRRNAVTLGIDPRRIVLAGDSAGANLAVAVCLAAREFEIESPSAALLSYGTYDADFSRPSFRQWDGDGYLLTTRKMAWFWDRYVPDAVLRRHPFAAPLHADLSDLPPMQFTVAGQDVLLDENLAFARKAETQGVETDVAIYPHGVHGFMEAIAFAELSKRALAHQMDWLKSIPGFWPEMS